MSSLFSCSLVISVLRSVFSCSASLSFLLRFTFSLFVCSFFVVSFVSLSLSPFVYHWCWFLSVCWSHSLLFLFPRLGFPRVFWWLSSLSLTSLLSVWIILSSCHDRSLCLLISLVFFYNFHFSVILILLGWFPWLFGSFLLFLFLGCWRVLFGCGRTFGIFLCALIRS